MNKKRMEIINSKGKIKNLIQAEEKIIREAEARRKPLKIELRRLDKELELLNHKKMF